IREELAQDVGAHPGEHGVLPQPLAPLGLDAVHEAGQVEVVALLLAAAAVGDDESAAAIDSHEVEEAQSPHAAKGLGVETIREPETLECGRGDGMVDEEERRARRTL